jgi:zinc transport system substrate-binding protein
MKRWQPLLCLIAWLLMPLADVSAAGRLLVFVSILPQQYFVQQIGGDHVEVQVMVPPGASPATYEPSPRQMVGLAKARLYFAIGVPFEAAWMDKIAAASPALTVVHTDRGIRKRPMAAHTHDEDGAPPAAARPENGNREHPAGDVPRQTHGTPDPHIWLSPPLVERQADTIMAALMAADPAHAGDYARNGRRFRAAVEALDRDLQGILASMKGRRFMVFHPSWGYFADAYGLEQVPIEVEGKDPKPAQLQALIEEARARHIRVIFAQPQFSRRSAALVASEIGGQVVLVDPLAPNWMDNLKQVASQFAAAAR